MIDIYKGTFTVNCDHCLEYLAEGDEQFTEVLHTMQINGWKTNHFSGKWTHLCPECATEWHKEVIQ
jgi:hypothetical protein